VESLSGYNQPPIVNAGEFFLSGTPGEVVHLNGSKSRDPNGTPLTFQWVQRSGTPVQLTNATSATPFFTVPAGLSQNETLTFDLVVSDGQFSSIPDSVSVYAYAQTNLAPLATITASSGNIQNGQTAVKAVDGVIDGYPGDYTKEWVTIDRGVGAWIRLAWMAPYSVNTVVLYDRPNLEDNILSATITFSDGSSIEVGPLYNGGMPTEVSFPSKIIYGLTVTINEVTNRTNNAGLSEVEVYGSPPGGIQYSLMTNASPSAGGSVTVNPSQSGYYSGTQVTLTAIPNTGYTSVAGVGTPAGQPIPLQFRLPVIRQSMPTFLRFSAPWQLPLRAD
jgi:hypothetical protein